MPGADGAARRSFAIIGYGKLGGKELGYASDLDLVFLYDDRRDEAARRIATRASRSGSSPGSPARPPPDRSTTPTCGCAPTAQRACSSSSLAAFARYQREQAWTWEHQALTRARFVAGDAAIGAAFEAERDAILRLPRDPAKLAADVVDMRREDARRAIPTRRTLFDLKHDPGGMVDIEFAVQYLVLAHAHAHAELTRNARQHRAARHGRRPRPRAARALAAEAADAYRDYRRLQHQIRLTGAPHARVDRRRSRSAAAARRSTARLWTASVRYVRVGHGSPGAGAR